MNKGYYTSSYDSARGSAKSGKKTHRAQRRTGEEKKKKTSSPTRSESRQEAKTTSSQKQSSAAGNESNRQRQTDAISSQRQEFKKSERRDTLISRSKDRQSRKLVQNTVDVSTMTERAANNEGAYQRALSVLSESFLLIAHHDKEKRPERWAQYAHSKKMLYWLEEITRISKTALNLLSSAAGRATTPAEWTSLATLVSYLIDVATIFNKYGHPDDTLDGEISSVMNELNKHLEEASLNTEREAFKPISGMFLRLHAVMAAGKLGKRSGTVFFQTRSAGSEFKLTVHECTRRLQMLSCSEYNRRTYPYDGVYLDGKITPLEPGTPVGFRSTPLRVFMKNELVEILLNHRRLFDMQTTKFPTFGDLPPTPWIGATLQAAIWSKSKRSKRTAMDMTKALRRIVGKAADDEVVEVVDVPQHPLPQAEYEQLTECPYQRYRPNVVTGPLSVKREAHSPAGTNSSKKYRPTGSSLGHAVPSTSDAIVTVTLDDDEKPAVRTQVGRLSSDPNPCQGPRKQKTADSPPTIRVQSSTSAISPAATSPACPATVRSPAPGISSAAVLAAEPPAAPPQQSVAAETVADVVAAAEPTATPPPPAVMLQLPPAAPAPDTPVQSTEHSQEHNVVCEPVAQFSPPVEPQPYAHVDMEDFAGPRLPSMPEFWQQNELPPILLTDQDVMGHQNEQGDRQLSTPETPEALEMIKETDDEV